MAARRLFLAHAAGSAEPSFPDGTPLPDAVASFMHPLFKFENSLRKRLGMENTAQRGFFTG